MAEEILLTRESRDKLQAELEELTSVKRKEVAEQLKEARSYGDLSENAEYDAAKDEQAKLDERIHNLEAMLRVAKIINVDDIKGDKVSVGTLVTVRDEVTKEKVKYVLVGATDSDPFVEPARISSESAVGAALIGKKKGEMVEIQIPDGVLHYTVVKIEKHKM